MALALQMEHTDPNVSPLLFAHVTCRRATSDLHMLSSADDGREVEVYLMDGGILRSHRELRGRVLITDFHKVPVEKGGGHREVTCKWNTCLFQ